MQPARLGRVEHKVRRHRLFDYGLLTEDLDVHSLLVVHKGEVWLLEVVNRVLQLLSHTFFILIIRNTFLPH